MRIDSQLRKTIVDQIKQERSERVTSRPKSSKCISCSGGFVEHKLFVTLTCILTIYALSADDFRLIATELPADLYFNIITLVVFTIFAVEVVLSSIGKPDYFLGFFFALDVISTATLILDLTWVSDALLQGDEEDLDNLKGSKTARIGARAARVVRVLRLVRILKLYRAMYEVRQQQKRKKKIDKPGDDWAEEVDDIEDQQMLRESNVGKKLQELTTRKVILLVLTMMLVLPLLTIDPAEQLPTTMSYGADLVQDSYRQMENNVSRREAYERAVLQYMYYHSWVTQKRGCGNSDKFCSADNLANVFWVGLAGPNLNILESKARIASVRPETLKVWEQEVNQEQRGTFIYGSLPAEVQAHLLADWDVSCTATNGKMKRLGMSVLSTKISGLIDYTVECPEDIRKMERRKFAPRVRSLEESKNWHFAFYADLRPYVKLESLFNMIVMVFVCVALLTASMFISNDANVLVLKPVESMILKVEMIRINPLMATKLADDAFKSEEIQKAKKRRKECDSRHSLRRVLACVRRQKPGSEANQPMETMILEKTIIKLGTLLAIGFGEAGASIIGQNMSGDNSAQVNAMIPGSQVDCICGQIRIRDFAVATEVLQAKVMTFVNQVAEIVHGLADEFFGAPNRNTGDTFLAVWVTYGMDDMLISRFADMALLALVRMFGGVHRSTVLSSYRGHPGLQQRLGKFFRVSLSFGLHYGWAIEGAVGTEFKIDASYLSPNVTVTEGIEKATNTYGVNFLLTQSVFDILTPGMQGKCRLIDRVMLTGSVKPLDLFVVDLTPMFLTVEVPKESSCVNWGSRQRFRMRQFLDAEKAQKLCEDTSILGMFNNDLDVNTMRAPYTLPFLHIFTMGYQNYSQGEWQVAQNILEKSRKMLGFEDGPSARLLTFMGSCNFEAPEGWVGMHSLDVAAVGQGLDARLTFASSMKTLSVQKLSMPRLLEEVQVADGDDVLEPPDWDLATDDIATEECAALKSRIH